MKTSSSRCSFAEVVRATTGYAANFGGVKMLLLGNLDLFLVAECIEWANGREELRLVVDCFEMEKQLKKAESSSKVIFGSVKEKGEEDEGYSRHSLSEEVTRACVEEAVFGLSLKWAGFLVLDWAKYP